MSPKSRPVRKVADLVTPGLPLLSCLPREAINKEIMAKQFTPRLWVSLMPFKCANHFFHYSTERDRERGRGLVGMGDAEIKTALEDRQHVQM